MHEPLALLALGALLLVAVRRPRGVPEVAVAVPAVALLLAVGAISGTDARDEVESARTGRRVPRGGPRDRRLL